MKVLRNAVCALFTAALLSATGVARGDGGVWSCGSNTYGQLGNGTFTNSSLPAQVNNLSGVVAVAGGYYHTLALKNDGTVWAWGYNESGQLGNGTKVSTNLPVQVQHLSGVVAIACGYGHSLAVKNDGTVWAWGSNTFFVYGHFTPHDASLPLQVKSLSGVVAVAGGFNYSLALKNDGTVWKWSGFGSYGTLPAQVQNLSGVVAIAAGAFHNLALKNDSTVWAWGDNSYGQLGDGTTDGRDLPAQVHNLSGVVAVDGGSWHSLAVKNDGTAWAWGGGQLGDGTTTVSSVPVQVKNLSGVVAVAGGEYHSLALKSDGTVWAWGSGTSGQLGDSIAYSPLPVQMTGLSGIAAISAGGSHTLAADRVTGPTPVTLNLRNANGQIAKETTLAATLSVTMTGMKVAGRTILFRIDGVDVGTAVTDAGGVARYVFTVAEGTALNLHPTAASFAGDQEYAPASASGNLFIQGGIVSFYIPNVAGYPGQTVTFSATLKNAAGIALAGRTVSFSLDGTPIGSATTDSSGKAKLSYLIPGNATLGKHTLIAISTGDSNYGTVAKFATLTVTQIPTKLPVYPNAGYAGTSVNLCARLFDAFNAPMVGATLSYSMNGALLGTAITDATGQAKFPYAIPAGTASGIYPFTVTYAGDATHLPRTNTGNLTVK